ncbi:flavodoxin family protein [Sporomusa malonica]|uniref:NADPH-dependent FMN reductase n=1 Tax=Sporomusa malonica TaxID=112901 RepID=A0A1W2F1Q3_9FIRM|nr:flavodoxin family protein [Sporomusa malonica]SMD15851.1 NADPH-dependent FMN reductase [Sporomusa malonica]
MCTCENINEDHPGVKKVLGVVGSPRKQGNTHAMVLSVMEGAKASGAEAEIVFLGDLNIRECNGCHACWKTGQCIQNDDMRKLYDKIIQSDAIVFGTPVYWYGPTALIKAFLDRFVYFNCLENRSKIKNKSVALVIPFEEDDPKTAELIITLFERSFNYLDMHLTGTVIAPGLLHKGQVLKNSVIMQSTLELGKKLILDIS